MEYYPCCAEHFPYSMEQWCGNTRFAPHYVTTLIFREKFIIEDEAGAAKIVEYDRSDAA